MSSGGTQNLANAKKREMLSPPESELDLPAPPKEQPKQAQREQAAPAQRIAPTPPVEEQVGVATGQEAATPIAQNADVQGMKCVTHPWRPAYAQCDYCKRPFCYADLVKYGQDLYCLEDIDNVSAVTGVPVYGNVSFSHLAGAILIIGAFVLAYFIYPTAIFFLNTISAKGFSYFINTFVSTYTYQAINLSIMFFSFVFGLLLIAKPRLGFYPSLMLGVLALIALSYQYFNTGTDYFLLVTAIELAGLASLMYSRMSASTMDVTEQEIKPNDINWPRPEVF